MFQFDSYFVYFLANLLFYNLSFNLTNILFTSIVNRPFTCIYFYFFFWFFGCCFFDMGVYLPTFNKHDFFVWFLHRFFCPVKSEVDYFEDVIYLVVRALWERFICQGWQLFIIISLNMEKFSTGSGMEIKIRSNSSFFRCSFRSGVCALTIK